MSLPKFFFFFSSRRRHTRCSRDWSSDVCSSDLKIVSHNEHVEEFLKKTDEKPDIVILDPPRAGLGAEAAEKLAELGAKEIVYLSCDPSTLARDLDRKSVV